MSNHDDGSVERNGDGIPSVSKRSVLKGMTGLAAGTAGLASGVGAVLSDTCLGDSFSCSSGFEEAPSDYQYLDLREDPPGLHGDWPSSPSELVFFVHGWGSDTSDAFKNVSYTFELAAEQNGFDRPTVAVVYDTNKYLEDFETSIQSAKDAGKKLAAWLRDYDAANSTDTYRFVGHSLGGHVLASMLENLDGDVVVEDIGFFGVALATKSVCEENGEFGHGVAVSSDDTHNYRSSNDEVICDCVPLLTGEDALGCLPPDCGSSDSPPANFHDHDVTDAVEGHCDYPKPDVGCVDQLVEDWQND